MLRIKIISMLLSFSLVFMSAAPAGSFHGLTPPGESELAAAVNAEADAAERRSMAEFACNELPREMLLSNLTEDAILGAGDALSKIDFLDLKPASRLYITFVVLEEQLRISKQSKDISIPDSLINKINTIIIPALRALEILTEKYPERILNIHAHITNQEELNFLCRFYHFFAGFDIDSNLDNTMAEIKMPPSTYPISQLLIAQMHKLGVFSIGIKISEKEMERLLLTKPKEIFLSSLAFTEMHDDDDDDTIIILRKQYWLKDSGLFFEKLEEYAFKGRLKDIVHAALLGNFEGIKEIIRRLFNDADYDVRIKALYIARTVYPAMHAEIIRNQKKSGTILHKPAEDISSAANNNKEPEHDSTVNKLRKMFESRKYPLMITALKSISSKPSDIDRSERLTIRSFLFKVIQNPDIHIPIELRQESLWAAYKMIGHNINWLKNIAIIEAAILLSCLVRGNEMPIRDTAYRIIKEIYTVFNEASLTGETLQFKKAMANELSLYLQDKERYISDKDAGSNKMGKRRIVTALLIDLLIARRAYGTDETDELINLLYERIGNMSVVRYWVYSFLIFFGVVIAVPVCVRFLAHLYREALNLREAPLYRHNRVITHMHSSAVSGIDIISRRFSDAAEDKSTLSASNTALTDVDFLAGIKKKDRGKSTSIEKDNLNILIDCLAFNKTYAGFFNWKNTRRVARDFTHKIFDIIEHMLDVSYCRGSGFTVTRANWTIMEYFGNSDNFNRWMKTLGWWGKRREFRRRIVDVKKVIDRIRDKYAQKESASKAAQRNTLAKYERALRQSQ